MGYIKQSKKNLVIYNNTTIGFATLLTQNF